jgi:hypothetical protein
LLLFTSSRNPERPDKMSSACKWKCLAVAVGQEDEQLKKNLNLF